MTTRTPGVKIGLPLRLIVWFSRFPDEELSATEVKQKFGDGDIYSRLRNYTTYGLLLARKGPRFTPRGGTQEEYYYSAGPRLKAMIKKYEV
jgi:hypothetical protein